MVKSASAAQELKQQVGVAAAAQVTAGMVVGLGTGSTVAFTIAELGRRIRNESLDICGVPTSFSASQLAREHGIPLRTLDDVTAIDIAIDGADEVDPANNLIKGGGAAHTQEKVIDTFARRFIVVVDDSKLVNCLGEKFAVPLTVLPFAWKAVSIRLREIGAEPRLRMGSGKDGPVVSDQGHLVVDAQFPTISDPAGLDAKLNAIPGLVGTRFVRRSC